MLYWCLQICFSKNCESRSACNFQTLHQFGVFALEPELWFWFKFQSIKSTRHLQIYTSSMHFEVPPLWSWKSTWVNRLWQEPPAPVPAHVARAPLSYLQELCVAGLWRGEKTLLYFFSLPLHCVLQRVEGLEKHCGTAYKTWGSTAGAEGGGTRLIGGANYPLGAIFFHG